MVKVKKDKKESDVPTIEAVITSAVVAEGPKIAKEAAVQEGEVAALRVQLAEAQEAVAALEAIPPIYVALASAATRVVSARRLAHEARRRTGGAGAVGATAIAIRTNAVTAAAPSHWPSAGSPPPAALKKAVPKCLSVKIMVIAPAKTGITAISK